MRFNFIPYPWYVYDTQIRLENEDRITLLIFNLFTDKRKREDKFIGVA